LNRKLNKMDRVIAKLINEEAILIAEADVAAKLEVISRVFDLPMAVLVKYTAGTKGNFCRGMNKGFCRCYKKPRANGFCGFHQDQVPAPMPVEGVRVKAPWED